MEWCRLGQRSKIWMGLGLRRGMVFLLTVGCLGTIGTTRVVADEEVANARGELVDVLKALQRQKTWTFVGGVKEILPESAGSGMRIVSAGGRQAPAFTGPVEVMFAGSDGVLVTSPETIPGFSLCVLGRGQSILRTTTNSASAPQNFQNLSRDLGALLDLRRLVSAVEQCPSVSGVRTSKGKAVYTCRFPPGLVPEPESVGGMGFARPKVMRVGLKAEVSRDGEIDTLLFAVIRSDPMAGFRKQAMGGQLSGGNVSVQFDPSQDEGEAEEGNTSVYEFSRGKAEASSRQEKCWKEMQELVKSQ